MTIENTMINLYPTQIESISLHRVGNKNKNEGIFLSDEPFNLNDETTGLLKEYFFRPFREKEENYFKLTNEVDIEFNELHTIVSAIFDEPSSAHENSKKIARHLFEQSNHPHIKSGEVYVAYLTGILLDNVKVDAIVILHGTDTMAETGELLSGELTDLQIPVILTGAMRPYKFRNSDALQNVTESLLAARLVSPGVYVVMHNRVLRFPGVIKDRENLTFVKA